MNHSSLVVKELARFAGWLIVERDSVARWQRE